MSSAAMGRSRVGLGSLSESSERLAIRRPPRALDRLMSPFMVTGVVWLVERAGLWDGGGRLGRVDRWVGQGGGAVAGCWYRDWQPARCDSLELMRLWPGPAWMLPVTVTANRN